MLELRPGYPWVPNATFHHSSAMRSVWLEMRSNADGLPGPVLEVNDTQMPDNTSIVLVIGNPSARLLNSEGEFASIDASLELDKHRVVLHSLRPDLYMASAGLHYSGSVSRILGGPQPNGLTRICLSQVHVSQSFAPLTMAWKLYAQVISPFCSVVTLFADEFGGLDYTAELVAKWICMMNQSSIRPPPCLIIASSRPSSAKKFQNMLFAGILRHLRLQSVVGGITYAQVLERCRSCFNGYYIFDLSSECSLLAFMIEQSDTIAPSRLHARHAFSAEQFEKFSRQALYQFSENKSFSLLESSHGLSGTAYLHLQEVCQIADKQKKDASKMVASSLANHWLQHVHGPRKLTACDPLQLTRF